MGPERTAERQAGGSPIGTGRLLSAMGVAHGLVGAVLYRRELRSIADDGVIGAVPYRGPEAAAFWFLTASPLMWIYGRLVSAAERRGDSAALRQAHRAGLASSIVCTACLPVSGFWGWILLSLRGLHELRRGAG